MKNQFNYALFYDFHTLVTVPEVGKTFDAEAFTDQVKACGVDFLTFHARCNQGSAYYNTKIGKRHPSLTYDLIGQLCSACKRKGIKLSLYFNGHLSEEETIAHPEWLDVPMAPEVRNKCKESPFYHQICYNSGFVEHMKDMAVELATNYEFDGFFFDCLGASDCVCPKCVAEMKEKGIDWNDREAVRAFSHESSHRMCRYLTDEIRKVMPNSLFFFNGRPFEEVSDMDSHLECECLPTGGWGYDCLPQLAHYLRTIGGKTKTVLNMTGRFNNWGDFGGLRTEEGLEFDLFYGAAHGMRPDIGGHYHPRGDIDMPVFDRIKAIYKNMQQYDKWVLEAENNCDVALVYPRKHGYYYPASEKRSVTAAVRVLDEMKVQFDLVSEFVPWDKYKLLIFPDDVVFSEETTKRVEAHLARGGSILATGFSGLDPEKKGFTVKDWPCTYVGATPYKPVFFQPKGQYACDLPDMPLSIYASAAQTRPAPGATVEMVQVKPYMNYGWDGLHGNYYIAPEGPVEDPFLVKKGKIFYIAGELFVGYGKFGPKQFRQLLGRVLEELDPNPLLKTENLPSFARAIVQENGKYNLLHLLAYCPEKRLDCMIVEDRISVNDGVFALRTGEKKIKRVYLAPSEKEIPFTVENGYCRIQLDRFDGYALIVFEEE